MPDIPCRLAKLETLVDKQSKEMCCLEEDVKESLKEITETLKQMQQDTAKQKGFISGAVFVLSAIAACVSYIMNKFIGS